jgi:hypothetical protein
MEVKIIEDSISPASGPAPGVRLVSFQLKYWRAIHAEFMTHRVFSRNASSSRAIPVAKMLEQVRVDPASPLHWGKNQAGMQAREELGGEALEQARRYWLEAAQNAAAIAQSMGELGLHKQVANRILEPFQYIHVVVTATEWDNFFALRAHPDAQPEIQALALAMRTAMEASTPTPRAFGEWHLPYIAEAERQQYPLEDLQKFSAARCARVSYLKHDGSQPDIPSDLELFERLVGVDPIHASPIEHQATPMRDASERWLGGNFKGWIQFRKLYEQQGGQR